MSDPNRKLVNEMWEAGCALIALGQRLQRARCNEGRHEVIKRIKDALRKLEPRLEAIQWNAGLLEQAEEQAS